MPVYENKYKIRAWAAQKGLFRLLAFSRFTYLQLKDKKPVQTFFIMSWAPFIITLGLIYLTINVKILDKFGIPLKALPQFNAKFFKYYLFWQMPFVLFFTMVIGPPLIANDIRHKALPMILSKPISRAEYILGKFLILFILLSMVTWMQGVLLFIATTAAMPGESNWLQFFWSETIWILPRIFIFSLIVIITMNLLALCFSSLTNNHRFAGVGLIMFIIGSMVVAGMASQIFHMNILKSLSPVFSITNIAEFMFYTASVSYRSGNQLVVSVVYLLLLWGVSLLVLFSRVRAFSVFRE